MPTRPVFILAVLFVLASLAAACQPLPTETPPEPQRFVATASPTPEPTVTPRRRHGHSFALGHAAHSEPSVLELVR